jgi:flavin reductase (DIM6/NTAB) family NADH-FMN oxidoreductase RutF
MSLIPLRLMTLRAANYTSTNSPYGTTEWAISSLTATASNVVEPTHGAESALSAECKLYRQQKILNIRTGKMSTMLLHLEVVQWHVKKDVIGKEQTTVDIKALRPIWRAGGVTYGSAFQDKEKRSRNSLG